METTATGQMSVQVQMGVAAQLGDRGSPRKDHELVNFIGRHGIVCIEHVMTELGVRRAQAYRRVANLIEAGLLERLDLLSAEPSLLRATRAGLRFAGLGLPLAVVSPAAVDHCLRCVSTAQLLAGEFDPTQVLTERELILWERIEEHPIASARVGERHLHRPDLVILTADRPIAIEVELTPKAPDRLRQLIRAWRRASWVGEVRYYCAPGPTQRGVQRAVAKMCAEDRVRIFEVVPR